MTSALTSMESAPPLVVGLGGTGRSASSTERALRVALAAAEEAGATTLCFGSDRLELPLYAPESSDRNAGACELVDALASADGIVVASPGYHGGMSGRVKNALDYSEDLSGRPRPYLEGRAVGCIVCAAGPQAAVTTLMSMRSVIHALRAWPTPLGVTLNTAEPLFDESGALLDPDIASRLATVGRQVVEFCHLRAARSAPLPS